MNHISFRCEGCQARIKAPAQLHGQMRSCPRCGHRFIVAPRPVEDAGPALVFDAVPASRTAPQE
jgi:DNA-directed RNA polymerase subunit RPC12/RpoP